MDFYGFVNPAKSRLQIFIHTKFKKELLHFFEQKKNLMLGIWREKSWCCSKFPILHSICFYYSSPSKLQNVILHVSFKGGGIFW